MIESDQKSNDLTERRTDLWSELTPTYHNCFRSELLVTKNAQINVLLSSNCRSLNCSCCQDPGILVCELENALTAPITPNADVDQRSKLHTIHPNNVHEQEICYRSLSVNALESHAAATTSWSVSHSGSTPVNPPLQNITEIDLPIVGSSCMPSTSRPYYFVNPTGTPYVGTSQTRGALTRQHSSAPSQASVPAAQPHGGQTVLPTSFLSMYSISLRIATPPISASRCLPMCLNPLLTPTASPPQLGSDPRRTQVLGTQPGTSFPGQNALRGLGESGVM